MNLADGVSLIQRTLDPQVSPGWLRQRIAEWPRGVILHPDSFLIAEKGRDTTRILKFGVAEDARLKGIGKRLLAEFEDICRQEGIGLVHLEVRASNAGARAFYASQGFREVGVLPEFYPDGDRRGIRMVKELGLQKGGSGGFTFPWRAEARIVKSDAQSGIVEGIASYEMLDKQGDLIDLAAFQRSAQVYMDLGGPIMLQHYPVPVGRLVEPPVFTANEVRLKAWVTDKTVSGQETRKGIESGKYKGFSIGGEVRAQHRECGVKAASCYNRITEIDWFETSVVETPANPKALIESFTRGLAKRCLQKPLPDFSSVEECMTSDAMRAEFPDETQRYAVCLDIIGKGSLLRTALRPDNIAPQSDIVVSGAEPIVCSSCGHPQTRPPTTEKSQSTPEGAGSAGPTPPKETNSMTAKQEKCPHCGEDMKDGKCPKCDAQKGADFAKACAKLDELTAAQKALPDLIAAAVAKALTPPASAPAKTEDPVEVLKKQMADLEAKHAAELAALKKERDGIGSRAPQGSPAPKPLNFELRKSLEDEAANPKTPSSRRVAIFRELGVAEAELHPGPTRQGVR